MMEGMSKGSLDRRSFLKGAALAGIGAAGAAALTGCSTAEEPKADSLASTEGESASAVEVTEDGWVETENSKPIEPVDPPASYDYEADVVIVGGGGGGLLASVCLAKEGLDVILVEKADRVGGSTSQASIWQHYGGSQKLGYGDWGVYGTPYKGQDVSDHYNHDMEYTIDQDLMNAMIEAGPKAVDAAIDAGAKIVDYGWVIGPDVLTGYLNHEGCADSHGIIEICQEIEAASLAAGVQHMCLMPVQNLVAEDGRVVGVLAKSGETGEDVYFHAKKAVLMTAGGMAANRDMLLRWEPYLGKTAATCTLMPTTTGECIRMGLGMGGTITGMDSFSVRDGGIDPLNGKFVYRSMWDGGEALMRQPWMAFNILGHRLRYFTMDLNDQAEVGNQEKRTCMNDMATFGSRRIVVFDSGYEDYIKNFNEAGARLLYSPDGVIRNPVMDGAISIVDADWHDGFQRGLDGGYIVQADTLEELAEALGVDPEIMTGVVADWNEYCEAGGEFAEGSELDAYGYKKEWLNKIENPPFFGSKTGAAVQGTGAGLLVNTSMQVLTDKNEVIPGLYAGFQTAGGFGGQRYNDMGLFGGVGSSFTGGYMAYEGIMANEA